MGVSPRLLGLELYLATSLSSASILVGAMNHYWSVGAPLLLRRPRSTARTRDHYCFEPLCA